MTLKILQLFFRIGLLGFSLGWLPIARAGAEEIQAVCIENNQPFCFSLKQEGGLKLEISGPHIHRLGSLNPSQAAELKGHFQSLLKVAEQGQKLRLMLKELVERSQCTKITFQDVDKDRSLMVYCVRPNSKEGEIVSQEQEKMMELAGQGNP